jgi:hypothetical protein
VQGLFLQAANRQSSNNRAAAGSVLKINGYMTWRCLSCASSVDQLVLYIAQAARKVLRPRVPSVNIRRCKEGFTMAPKQASKRKRRRTALPAWGVAGVSLSLAGGASAATSGPATDLPSQGTGAHHEIALGEEEISDVSLATFYVFDKENAGASERSQGLQLARGCGGCGCRGCGGGCRGGFGGCRGCGVGCRGCVGFRGCGGCGGGWWWGGWGGCSCCASWGACRWC